VDPTPPQRIATEVMVRRYLHRRPRDSIRIGEGIRTGPIGLSDEGFLLPLLSRDSGRPILSSTGRLQRRTGLRSA